MAEDEEYDYHAGNTQMQGSQYDGGSLQDGNYHNLEHLESQHDSGLHFDDTVVGGYNPEMVDPMAMAN